MKHRKLYFRGINLTTNHNKLKCNQSGANWLKDVINRNDFTCVKITTK